MKRKSFTTGLSNFLARIIKQVLHNGTRPSGLKAKGADNDAGKQSFSDGPYAFNLSRISPDNNIEMILGAFVQAPQHQIVICGDWDKSEYGRTLRNSYGIFPNIHMMDMVYDQAELDRLRSNAFAYIHGNHPGGVDEAVLEAMLIGLPMIALETADNRISTNNEALYFSSAEELAYVINTTTVGRFRSVGKCMQKIAQQPYVAQPAFGSFQYLFKNMYGKRKEGLTQSGFKFDMGY